MEKTINRALYSKLKKSLEEKYIAVILGPRQVGKTTLLNNLIADLKQSGVKNKEIVFFNFDDPQLRSELEIKPKSILEKIEMQLGEPLSALSNKKYLFIDEAQKAPAIFDILKIIYDQYPEKIKIVISGSSSLNLRQRSAETLAGRIRFYHLSSLSWNEIVDLPPSPISKSLITEVIDKNISYEMFLKYSSNILPIKNKADFDWQNYLLYGGLPEVFLLSDSQKKSEALSAYIDAYLEQDIKELREVGDANLFLQALNIFLLNNGQSLNFSSLAEQIGIQRLTLKKYLHILEETFLLKELYPLVKPTKQSVKSSKIYFFDHGIVNYRHHIYSLDQLKLSSQLGSVFESIIVNNLFIHLSNNSQPPQINFWRDYQDHEIDLIISTSDKIIPIEISYSDKLAKNKLLNFKAFYQAFPQAEDGLIIWSGNWQEWQIEGKTIRAIPYWLWL